jgi:hypothetical protein
VLELESNFITELLLSVFFISIEKLTPAVGSLELILIKTPRVSLLVVTVPTALSGLVVNFIASSSGGGITGLDSVLEQDTVAMIARHRNKCFITIFNIY